MSHSIRATIALLAITAVAATGAAHADSAHAANPRIQVGRHGVVHASTLPHCTVEDGSSGPLPCTWNIGADVDGNGAGLAYYVTRDHRVHYVWTHNPRTSTSHNWRWVDATESDAFAEGGYPDSTPFHKCIDWNSPNWQHGGLYCPNGVRDRW